jgi:hypothetical protein
MNIFVSFLHNTLMNIISMSVTDSIASSSNDGSIGAYITNVFKKPTSVPSSSSNSTTNSIGSYIRKIFKPPSISSCSCDDSKNSIGSYIRKVFKQPPSIVWVPIEGTDSSVVGSHYDDCDGDNSAELESSNQWFYKNSQRFSHKKWYVNYM